MHKPDEDFYNWALEQAAALRAHDIEALDWDALAEEVELLAAKERREMRDRLKTLQEHLLKLRYRADEAAELHGWRHTIERTRDAIGEILRDSPGVFAGQADEMVAEVYPAARREAARRSPAPDLPRSTFPAECPWTYAQIIDEEFFPGVTKS